MRIGVAGHECCVKMAGWWNLGGRTARLRLTTKARFFFPPSDVNPTFGDEIPGIVRQPNTHEIPGERLGKMLPVRRT